MFLKSTRILLYWSSLYGETNKLLPRSLWCSACSFHGKVPVVLQKSKKDVKLYEKVVGLGRKKEDRYGIYKSKYKKKEALLRNDNCDIILDKIDFSTLTLQSVFKTSYNPTPLCLNRSKEDITNHRKKNEIVCRGVDVDNPIIEFADYDFPDFINRQLEDDKFAHPLPIQNYGWPVALMGRDLIGLSQTGSGKSLAYIIPMLIHSFLQPPSHLGDGPVSVIIVPTLELCDQVYSVILKYIQGTRLKCTTLHSGASRESQLRIIRKGIDVCVATPGRLITLMADKEMDLLRCSLVIIDEADKLLECAQDSQVLEIISQIRPDHQTLMFSATWPLSFGWLIEKLLVDEVEIFVGSAELGTNPNISQDFYFCDWRDIKEKVIEVLKTVLEENCDNLKILLFANNHEQANKYEKIINEHFPTSFIIDLIHGDKKSANREVALKRFRAGYVNLLIATDIAARGLDVANITHVISVGFPFTCEQYIHRIGRTGRVGRKGSAHTIIFSIDKGECSRLIALLRDHNKFVPKELYGYLNQIEEKRRMKKRFKWQ